MCAFADRERFHVRSLRSVIGSRCGQGSGVNGELSQITPNRGPEIIGGIQKSRSAALGGINSNFDLLDIDTGLDGGAVTLYGPMPKADPGDFSHPGDRNKGKKWVASTVAGLRSSNIGSMFARSKVTHPIRNSIGRSFRTYPI